MNRLAATAEPVRLYVNELRRTKSVRLPNRFGSDVEPFRFALNRFGSRLNRVGSPEPVRLYVNELRRTKSVRLRRKWRTGRELKNGNNSKAVRDMTIPLQRLTKSTPNAWIDT
jgi:hypothetical protein